jgi:hypothetical protein
MAKQPETTAHEPLATPTSERSLGDAPPAYQLADAEQSATDPQRILVSVPLVVNGGDGKPTTLTMVLSTVDRSVAFGEQVIVYADEQGGSSAKQSDEFAIGLEFGPTPIDDAAIREALAARSCSYGCSKNPFFHARADCAACKQLFAEIIRTRLQNRFFISLRWKHKEAQSKHPKGSELHQHALALALGFISSIDTVRHIIVKFERIQGLSVQTLNRWFHEDAENRVDTMIRYGIPVPIVPIDFEPASKEEPGIQVCDYLLWAERRALNGETAPWERSDMSFDHSQDHPPYKITFYSRGGGTFPHRIRRPEPRDPGDFPWPQVVSMIYGIEVSIHNLAKAKPNDLRHLDRLISSASARTRGRRWLQFDAWQAIHRAFLSLADLYIKQPNLTDKERQAASDAAALSRIIADGRETRAISMFDAWQQIRMGLADRGDPNLT